MPRMPSRAIGIPWYRSEDWPAIRRVMIDGDRLPARYEDWLHRAEHTREQFAAAGDIVEKVYLDPVDFADWCRARDLNIDSAARNRFAAEFVGEKYRNRS
ncbi:MAG: hypothetical protein WD715_13220 [Dongiaceae bacterium]